MEMKYLQLIAQFFILLLNVPSVINVTCTWTGAILSENVCFLYNSTTLSYLDAKTACQSKGGVLATVKTMTQILESTSQAADFSSVWIGANDIAVEGTWVWEDTGAVATELTGFWQYDYGQPDNYTDTEDCADIFVTSVSEKRLWDDECDTALPFLCMERDLNTTPSPTVSTTPTAATSPITSTASHPATTTSAATIKINATTNAPTISTSAATIKTIVITNASASTTHTSAQTLTTNTRPTTSTTHLTTTASSKSANTMSTSTSKVAITTLKNKGADFIGFNVLIFLTLYAFYHLVI